VVIAGDFGDADTRAMREAIDRVWAPNAITLHRTPGAGPSAISDLAPFTAEQRAIDGRATAYVCERHACRAPTIDPAEATALLSRPR
jgi:uncharacterized protein YyaL (SSP411 family)